MKSILPHRPPFTPPKVSAKILWESFWTFFVIGGFTFGGGQAMLVLIREQVVARKKWLSDEEFIDLFAVSQSLPGVFAVNMSISIGYRLQGLVGAFVCAIGCTLPSFLVMLLVAIYFAQFRGNEEVERVFKGLRPAVVALIAAPVVSVWRTMGLGWRRLWIPVLVAVAVWRLDVSPITVIVVSGLLGWLYAWGIKKEYARRKNKERRDNEG